MAGVTSRLILKHCSKNCDKTSHVMMKENFIYIKKSLIFFITRRIILTLGYLRERGNTYIHEKSDFCFTKIIILIQLKLLIM